jgi:hypothetical protein
MKVIITENQYSLMRRVSQVENSIRPVMDNVYEYLQFGNSTPLNMSEYDTFIHVITTKISNQILNNESIFDPDKKEVLKKQIQRFIETEYMDIIREYFYSRMDKNINESTHDIKFKRRYEEIEEGIWDWILGHKLNVMDTFDSFLIEISWDVANKVLIKMNIPEDDYVTYRNQLIRFIKNNFYTELKDFWDRNHYWSKDKNINESYDKRIFQRRYQYISEFIDRALSRYDVCIYDDEIDFVDRVMDYTADHIYESLFNLEWDDDNHVDVYQDIYVFISEHFVDRIHEFYDDNKHICIDEDGNWIN